MGDALASAGMSSGLVAGVGWRLPVGWQELRDLRDIQRRESLEDVGEVFLLDCW